MTDVHPAVTPSDELTRGERYADAVKRQFGSWRFLIIQTVIVVAWIGYNVYSLYNFDPYPFILLNLLFSTQASYAAPLILLSQNRGDRISEQIAMNDLMYDQENLALTKQLIDRVDYLTSLVEGKE